MDGSSVPLVIAAVVHVLFLFHPPWGRDWPPCSNELLPYPPPGGLTQVSLGGIPSQVTLCVLLHNNQLLILL